MPSPRRSGGRGERVPVRGEVVMLDAGQQQGCSRRCDDVDAGLQQDVEMWML